ncbi:uncharacterized protein LOC134707506 [Mytilus trossulus]|uniref:uncharacterized protein LOC134707506 n=1 Tax=Mytilus trossulus TaxID=6551 RepID=UPI0030079900
MASNCLGFTFFKASISLLILLIETNGIPLINRELPTPRPAIKCQYKGTTYLEGATIKSGVTVDGCKYALVCNPGTGTVSTLHEPDYPRPTTTTTTLGGPIGYCFFNGHHYSPGQEISHGQSGNWCYSTYCSYDGQILNADNFNCSPKPTQTTIAVIQVG